MMGPENDNLSILPQDTVKLTEDPKYLRMIEVFKDAEIINAVKGFIREGQCENTSLSDVRSIRIVACIAVKCPGRNIDGGDILSAV
jgi:hypothetical protein